MNNPLPTAYSATLDFHRLLAQELPADDELQVADAHQGFIGTVEDAEVKGRGEHIVWSMKPYAFLDDEKSPDTVNPSLWRMARLNRLHGLFQVTPRIFQVRGFDIANITLIEGDTGLIALDALMCPETAAAALALYRQHRDPQALRPVHTVIYSHSHGDHFGGAPGLITQADVDAGKVQVIAPAGFLHHAVAENVIAGVAMARRTQFQFGNTLAVGPTGQVDSGLGKNLPKARPGLIAPTWSINDAHEAHTIDGVAIEFQLTPDTEAPAEMHFYFPGERALNLAENANHTMHNLCPLRGAQVRDSLAWSKYLHVALHRYASRSDVVLAQHHWPTFGHERVMRYVAEQRDMYRVLHDQTVRLMSHGLKPAEIAESLPWPHSLGQRWHARGYYGAVSHNVKAVYQRYLSWYDSHPANLHALPPVPAAIKTIEYMGGLDAVMARAHADMAKGEFRWVGEVMKHAVYAHPDHQAARELAAQAMEQMGFQAESATWRNSYLLAAREYREGPAKAPTAGPANMGLLSGLTIEMIFDTLAVRLNAPKAAGHNFDMAWHFTDLNERWLVSLSNSALSSLRADQLRSPLTSNVQLTLDRRTLEDLLAQRVPAMQAISEGRLKLSGDVALLAQFFAMLDRFSGSFPVVDAAKLPD